MSQLFFIGILGMHPRESPGAVGVNAAEMRLGKVVNDLEYCWNIAKQGVFVT